MFKSKIFLVLLVFLCGTVTTLAYDRTYNVYMAGNAHIDAAWQWTTATTINSYIPSTFNNAVNLMSSNSEYTFNASSSLFFKWIKQYYPGTYTNIQAKIASGQLNIVGGQYLEPDLNIPSGESLVRQSLFGQRFFKQEFGNYCIVGWVPDVFGFSGQLPQILKKSGMNYFVTTKLNWNDTDLFPNNNGGYAYEIFKWIGIDGSSQIIAYKPRQDYTASTVSDLVATLDEPNRHGIKKGLLLYGAGDRGGGPSQLDIDTIHLADAWPTNPNIKMYTANKFFNDLTSTDKSNITDLWSGEMYLENHRGTYTSQAIIKKNNRLGEITAEVAEKFSSLAKWLGATGYPQPNINYAWEKILQNQFHDVLPGSGTHDQVQEAWVTGQTALNTLGVVLNNAEAGIASKADTSVAVSGGVPVVVFNPLSFSRRQPVQTSVTFPAAPASIKVYDNTSQAEVPSQLLSANGNTATIVFIADTMPSIGYKVFTVVENTGSYSGSTGMSIGNNVITSDLFQVTINASTGNISGIVDKTNNNTQVLTGGEGNVLQILDDTPADYDAWNVDYGDMTATPLSTLGSTSGISIVENGPVKCTYRVDKSYGSSIFSQYITLYPAINRIDIRMTADWNESHKMLKVAFPWNVSGATSATYEIAYGALTRSNQRDTNFNKARFEVSAHRWADLSNGGYGVSLLNNCKYGYDTYLNTMRLSLLRSPKSPDDSADMGSYHDFTYSIYPHSGDWKSANTVSKGYELNYPLLACQTTAHPGSLGKSYSFISVNQPNVIISVVKKAEDTSDYIIRMNESQGTISTDATITLPENISSISETDLLENNIGTPSYNVNTFQVIFGPFDIRTFKAGFGGTTPPTVTGYGLDRCLGGTFTASAENPPNEGKDRAFDGNFSTKWLTSSSTGWIQCQFAGGAAYVINHYAVTSGNDYPARDPKSWTFLGSNDGSTWTALDTRSNVTWTDRFVKQMFSFTNTTAYNYYRLNITANSGDAKLQLSELEMFDNGSASGPTPTPTPPPPVGVVFYQNTNYGGTAAKVIPKGNFKLAQLQPYGFVNDWASSVKIPNGWTLIMYKDDNFMGTSWTLTADTPDFTKLSPSANDVVTSCKIQ
jgi:alpha-mannosidase